ncbi:ABCB family ABC transporter ATP-binding protein/permease [Alteromonas sp. a30]|uniref:ABCB family ABC transporter ATP-binding protein/permease n=1 Tax=Alteromonas sp. a30 TaxID=2730917 RepID=UPI00228067AF|nr:ABC transporter ATP-binding protein/permease [Alteromonas sp. a30]MCY7295237.1 ABC transporter ATP-binding protein/permease [Alteromonas sp. a30]
MRSNRFPIDENTEINWRVLKDLVPHLMEFRGRIVLAIAFLIAAKLATIGLPFILKYVVDGLNVKDTATQLVVVPVALIIAYGALRFAGVMFGEIRDTLFGRVTERAMRRVALKVFTHLHRLDLDFHLNRQTGGLSRDMERGVSGISFLMRFMVFNIVPTLFEIAAVVGVLFVQYGYHFSLVIFASVVAYVLFSMRATDWRTQYVREMNQADTSSNSRAIDSLLNYETVKYFNNEEYEAKRYDVDLKAWEDARRKNRLSVFVLNGGQAFIIASAMTGMLVFAGFGVQSGDMTIGDFVLINAMTMQIFMPLNFLGFVYREIRGSLANIENMFKMLNQAPKVVDNENATELTAKEGKIEFKNVHFHYQPDRPILRGVSFDVKPGQKVAIVGGSGAGKSTIIKLLFRFYDAEQGEILVDGQNIKTVTQSSLRKLIGIVPQDTVLFNDTLFENIRYGNPKASDDEVKQAARLAHLDHFIDSLPQGAETQVGERGLKLSGGEKQRVAIARTVLKRPPIMLFDEATSSLDSHAEQAILQALKEIAQGHTSLVIAHRLSTIVDADKIIVMDKGTITEQGTHHALLKKGGLYAQLWHTQQSSEEDESSKDKVNKER